MDPLVSVCIALMTKILEQDLPPAQITVISERHRPPKSAPRPAENPDFDVAPEFLRFDSVRRLTMFVGIGLLLSDCGSPQRPPPKPPDVGVVTLLPQHVPLTTELPALVNPYMTSDVRPQVTGILKSILFKQGGLVRAGEALYQIDPAPYQAAYDSAKAAVANAEASLADSRIKADRYAGLIKENAISKQDYDDVQAAYKEAAATVLQDKANLEAAKVNLDYTRITAPITGRIGRSIVTPGALLSANQTTALATIQTLDPIYVDMNQSSAELVQLERSAAAGQLSRNGPAAARVTLLLEDGTLYGHDGTLEFSEVTVDSATGAVVLRAVFPNPEGLLLPGMYVRATIVEGVANNAILAPQRGVTRDEKGEPTAMIVDKQGVARLRILKAARTVGSNWLVTSGLVAGDKLIVDGLQKVQPGRPVHAVPADTNP